MKMDGSVMVYFSIDFSSINKLSILSHMIKRNFVVERVVSIFSCGMLISDIDECIEGIDGCAQTCTNTEGSYTCSCNSGYRLTNDSLECDGRLLISHDFIV